MTERANLELDTLTIRIPIRLQRRGGRKLIMTPEGVTAPARKPSRDETLIKALVRAHRWRRKIESGQAKSITVSAGLAQIGEFSFILAGLGVGLGFLPPEGRDLILAGALLSITLNPLVFVAADRSSAWLRTRPTLLAWLERSGDPLTGGEGLELKAARWENHSVIVGYGRVGGPIGQALQQQGIPHIVVERDRRRVRELRARGQTVVWGDAAAAGVLEAAHVGSARLLVIAAPDALQARRILDVARRANPRIDTLARAHADGEMTYLERQGVGMAVMGERELALSMADYALRSLGLFDDKARLVVQGLRVSGEAANRKTEP